MNKAIGTPAAGAKGLAFPFPEPPAPGAVREVAPGILWARIPLPFKLDHVNVYFIEDDGGWAVLDTGTADDAARATWDALLSGPLAGERITKLIATHAHADHIGLAGWLCERLDIPLLTSRACYLGSVNTLASPQTMASPEYRAFHERHGMRKEAAMLVAGRGHAFCKNVLPLPLSYTRLAAGGTLRLGGRAFDVMSGDGHAPEQIMLYCACENLLLAADQVIAGISATISVSAMEPDDDPLGAYLVSLAMLMSELPDSTLVLSGHLLPFVGLRERCRQLVVHHERRCAIVADAIVVPPKVDDLVPIVFPHRLDTRDYGFAFGETHAHVNHLVAGGKAAWSWDGPLDRAMAV